MEGRRTLETRRGLGARRQADSSTLRSSPCAGDGPPHLGATVEVVSAWSHPPRERPDVCPLLRKTLSLSAGEDVLFLQTPEGPETPPPGPPPSFCPTRGGEGLVPGQASAVGAPPPKTPPPRCVKKGETRACRHLPVGTQHLGSCLTPAWAEDGEEQDAGLIMGLVQGFHRLRSPAAHAVLGQARQRGHVGRPGRAR